jgi:hypothetical protein
MIRGPFIFTVIVSIFLLAFLMNGFANLSESQPSAPDQKFSVVDTYRGCSVVQYTPTNAARYTYFLDCKK